MEQINKLCGVLARWDTIQDIESGWITAICEEHADEPPKPNVEQKKPGTKGDLVLFHLYQVQNWPILICAGRSQDSGFLGGEVSSDRGGAQVGLLDCWHCKSEGDLVLLSGVLALRSRARHRVSVLENNNSHLFRDEWHIQKKKSLFLSKYMLRTEIQPCRDSADLRPQWDLKNCQHRCPLQRWCPQQRQAFT